MWFYFRHLRYFRQAFLNVEAKGMPPVPMLQDGSFGEGPDTVAHQSPWVQMVHDEFDRICDNEIRWRRIKRNLWWESVAIHERWNMGAVLNWIAWERLLVIDMRGRTPGDLLIAPSITATGRERELLMAPLSLPGTYTMRQPPNAD